jgi:hypothetical protein
MATEIRQAGRTSRGKGHPLSIRLDAPRAPRPQWCWRDDWVQGGESIYSLIGLFQALNIVGSQQIRTNFVEASDPGLSRFVRHPVVSLLRPDRFRAAAFATSIRLSLDVVQQSFVSEAFPVSGWCGHQNLRWCPQCVKAGYHAPLFQLLMVYECPAHHRPLEQHCPRCRSAFPYQLTTGTQTPLFLCPACKLDLAPEMRAGRRRALAPEDMRMLDHSAKLMQFCDSLPTMVSQALGTASSPQGSDVLVSTPAAQVSESDFKTFVTQVLASLRLGDQTDWDRVEPSISFVDQRVQLGSRRRTKTCDAKSGWPDRLVAASDKGLYGAAALYRCVRRHHWRTIVHRHQRCVVSACRRLWWPITGSRTPCFCPVAMAFIRWRLRWESAVRCTDLIAEAIGPPLGIVTWLASAPVGPASAGQPMRDWLINHVFGYELLASFERMLVEEQGRPEDELVEWKRDWVAPAANCCWVCAGSGTKYQPARLFVRQNMFLECVQGCRAANGHYAKHLGAIARIDH